MGCGKFLLEPCRTGLRNNVRKTDQEDGKIEVEGVTQSGKAG